MKEVIPMGLLEAHLNSIHKWRDNFPVGKIINQVKRN